MLIPMVASQNSQKKKRIGVQCASIKKLGKKKTIA
jgi:hypothetical protein